MDLFFYREPEELEKAEEAQAPFQEPAAVAAPGWGAEPMVGAAPTPMEGFQPAAPVDPTAVPMEGFQAAAPAQEGLGGGWDTAPGAQEVAVDATPQEPQIGEPVMPAEAGVPPAAGGGWDAAPQAPAPAAQGGGWGDTPAQSGGGW